MTPEQAQRLHPVAVLELWRLQAIGIEYFGCDLAKILLAEALFGWMP